MTDPRLLPSCTLLMPLLELLAVEACASPPLPLADGPGVVWEAGVSCKPRVSLLEEDDSLAQALHSTHTTLHDNNMRYMQHASEGVGGEKRLIGVAEMPVLR